MPKRSFYHSLFERTNVLIPAAKKAPNDAIKSVISEKNHYRNIPFIVFER